MTEFIEKRFIYHEYQSGYRKNYTTTTFLMKQYENITTFLNNNEITIAILADYSKAFYTIDFFTLIQKMHSLTFFFMTRNSRQKLNILRTKRAFEVK